ncbi:hypothetical protein Vretimale_13813 [Volvox reticuliferus]|nr:hypothetical protein Vretimale_13813 [Volvox reticuliferus]
MELVRPTTGAQGDLFRHPRGQGTFYFTTAAAQHLPMLMACHLSPPLQRLLRHFSVPAQCAITARAMALYSRTSHLEYFRDQRLEAALTESRSHNPPQDRYCAYTLQAVRLTGRKRKPGASPHANAVAASPLTPRVAMAAAAATPALPGCLDVDMDTGGWSFVGGATLHCPGGAAGRKSGRHENWLLSDGADGGVTYLPVLYDNEEHSAVLLPLADPPANGCRAGEGNTPTRPPCVEKTLLWFRYEYESRGGRRGHNFWDKGLPEHLEQAIRDVAGEDALRAARGA